VLCSVRIVCYLLVVCLLTVSEVSHSRSVGHEYISIALSGQEAMCALSQRYFETARISSCFRQEAYGDCDMVGGEASGRR